MAMTGLKTIQKIPLDGIDLTPILVGSQTAVRPWGFVRAHGRPGHLNDRIIKALMEAERAGQPNPHPTRILKNVEQFLYLR